MHGQEVAYSLAGATYLGYLAIPEGKGPFPTVLVCHTWAGRDAFACSKADELAKLGYVGFAVDCYGEGRVGKNREENAQMLAPLKKDREELKRRLLAAVDAARRLPEVDAERMAAIGYCFGGLCALDLARAGAPLKGVVSFHGLLGAPKWQPSPSAIKVLVLHGNNDPMVPPQEVQAFAAEMEALRMDWQLHIYGKCVHAFTNPAAQDPAFGTVYDSKADARSWLSLKNFLREIMN